MRFPKIAAALAALPFMLAAALPAAAQQSITVDSATIGGKVYDSTGVSGTGTFTSAQTLTGAAINEAKGGDIASATTTNLCTATGNYVRVTGTTTITGLGTCQAGTRRIVQFAGILTLTHNSTSLVLPTGANITTAAGDVAVFVSEGSGNWRAASYQRADGKALVGATSVGLTMPAEFSVSGSPVTTSGTLAVTKANQNANIVFAGPASGSAAAPTFRALTTTDIAAAVAPLSGRTMTQALTGTVADPTALTWNKRGGLRPIDILAPGLTDLHDEFLADIGFYTHSTGAMTITYPGVETQFAGNSSFTQKWTDIVLKAPFYTTIIEVTSKGASATWNDYYTGLYKDASNYVAATYDDTAHQAWVEWDVAGSVSQSAKISLTAGSAPFKIAFVLNGNNAQVWFNSAASPAGLYSGWFLVQNSDISGIDLRDPAVLKNYHPGFGFYAAANTTARFGTFDCGYFGQVGLRDPRPVTFKDGSPYIVNGEYYFTMSGASVATIPGSVLGPAYGHQGIYAFNPKTRMLRKTGMIFVSRGAPLIYNDYAGQLVFDPDINAWRVLLPTWGNRATGSQIAIEYQTYQGDLLNGVTILDNMSNLSLSQFSGTVGVYDPSMTWDAATSQWRIAYTFVPDTNFGSANYAVALDHSASLGTFTNDFASGLTGYEGSQLVKLGGNYFVLGGSTANSKVWNTSGTVLGTLNITLPSTSVNPPWPTMFPVMDGSKTRWWLLTFDGSKFGSSDGSLASLWLYEATETETGWEFDLHGVQ